MLRELISPQPKGANDYAQDGLIVCGNCNTPKECCVEVCGEIEIVSCMCRCREAEHKRDLERDARHRRIDFIERVRRTGIRDASYLGQTFAVADGQTDLNFAKAYVENWQEYRSKNVGLMLYGDTGRGKTFAACCIVNSLIERGVSAMAWQFGELVDKLTSLFDDERDELLSRIRNVGVLLFDDFGAHRSTDTALEKAEMIIDARYRAKKPLIITTNLNIKDFKNIKDLRLKRTYERIIEMCFPKQIQGENRRVQMANDRFKEFRGAL